MITNILIIALTIFLEAGGESLYGREAVASVIVNRAEERNLTLVETCLQPKQFSCWNNRSHKFKDLITSVPVGKAWRECLVIAYRMNNGRFKPVGRWNHYFNPSLCNPSWGRLMTEVEIIGNHKFGVLN